MLNQGEPVERALVLSGRAPLPSITALGMPFALPGAPQFLHATLNESAPRKWLVFLKEMPEDMTVADKRREWLKTTFKLTEKAFLTISEVIESPTKMDISVRALGKLLFIFGSEFDLEGHEGQLQFDRIEGHLRKVF